MKKIGIIVGIVSRGDNILYMSESAKEWSKYIEEPRAYSSKVKNTNGESLFVDFVRYGEDVALLTLLLDDLGRGQDVIYGIITIPAGIDINGHELEGIINQVKEKLLNSPTPSESTKAFYDSLFGKEYPERSVPVSCQNSNNNTTIAYQKYGKSINYTYGEILERNLFSPCYNSHKAVFLISDEDVNNIIPKDGVVELTQKEVASHAILKYPTGCPYKLTIDGSPFDKDRVVTIGSIVKIHAERRGKNHYDPKEISVPINAQRVDITSTINGLTWNLRISKSWFEVVEFSKNTPIANFTIKINDKALLDYQHMSIPEADVKMANVVIEAPGYDSDAFILGTEIGKLQSESSKIKRELKESAKMYEYIVENKNRRNPNPVKFSIPDASYDEKLSPLEGYTVVKSIPKPDNQGTQIILRQKAGISKMLLAIIVGVSLLLIGASFWAGWQFAQNNTTNTTEESKSSTLGENISSDKGGDKGHGQVKKIEDLLSNAKWERDAFDKAGYGELWDVVDDYDYAKIAEIVEELEKDEIGIPKGTRDKYKYLSWNKVVNVVKNEEARKSLKTPSKPVSKNEVLNLGDWNKAVEAANKENSKDDSATELKKPRLATEQVSPAGAGGSADDTSLKTILQSKKWEKSKFTKHKPLWNALFDYNLDEIKKEQDKFDETTKDYIDCWENYREKLSKITNYTKIKSNSDKVEAWKWRENIKLTIIYALLKDENWESKYFQNSILVVNEKDPKILLSDLFNAVKNGNGNKIKECIDKIKSRLENILEIEHVNALYDLCKDTSIEPTIIAEWAKEHITD